MAAKFFTGLPLDGPDPECVLGHGARALRADEARDKPRPSVDHSRRKPKRASARALPVIQTSSLRPCEQHPVADLARPGGG